MKHELSSQTLISHHDRAAPLPLSLPFLLYRGANRAPATRPLYSCCLGGGRTIGRREARGCCFAGRMRKLMSRSRVVDDLSDGLESGTSRKIGQSHSANSFDVKESPDPYLRGIKSSRSITTARKKPAIRRTANRPPPRP